MSEIKSVAVAGASGNLGPHVIKALVDADFQVTVLTRSKEARAYDASIKVLEVELTSVESLTTALKGIDALVSTVAMTATESQTLLIDAAIAAGVKRFIPSEYGTCTTSPKVENFPIYAPMFKIKKYLHEKAEAGKLTWTVLAPGAFLEFLFGGSMLLDFENHKATLYDEGDNRISCTSLPKIGAAVAGILKNFEATKNKAVWISEVILTQNEVLAMAKSLKPDIKWEVTKIPAATVLKEGLDSAGAGDLSSPNIMKILLGTACGGDTYGSAYDVTDNELFGIKELTKEDVKTIVTGKLA